MRRPKEHCRESRKGKTHCHRWVAELLALNLKYEIVVLDRSSPDCLAELERWWIAYGRACDWPLTNITDGGEGTYGRKRTPESIAKMKANPNWIAATTSEAIKARWARMPPETAERRAQRSSVNKGKKFSPEFCKKLSESHPAPKHGSTAMYGRGCRCTDCVTAFRTHARERSRALRKDPVFRERDRLRTINWRKQNPEKYQASCQRSRAKVNPARRERRRLLREQKLSNPE